MRGWKTFGLIYCGWICGVKAAEQQEIVQRFRDFEKANPEPQNNLKKLDESSIPRDVIDQFDQLVFNKAEWKNAPAALQRALVYDLGYVATVDRGYAAVYPQCGKSMSSIRPTLKDYQQACSAFENNLLECPLTRVPSFRHSNCSAESIEPKVLCAALSSTTVDPRTSVFVGVREEDEKEVVLEVTPFPRLYRNEFDLHNGSLYTIHFHQEEDIRKCPEEIKEYIIPCRKFNPSLSGQFCQPQVSTLMKKWTESWLEDYTATSNASLKRWSLFLQVLVILVHIIL